MPTIYDIKPKFQALLRPITRDLAARRVTANQVTLAAFAISLVLGLQILVLAPRAWALLLLPPWMFLRMALNAIDGMLAREHGMKSNLGAMLNELSDVVADAALFLPFAFFLSGWGPTVLVVVVVLAIVSEMAGVAALQIGASRRYDGPMGKSDRAFVFGALALLLGIGVPPGAWSTALLLVIAALLCKTIYNRTARALAEAGDRSHR